MQPSLRPVEKLCISLGIYSFSYSKRPGRFKAAGPFFAVRSFFGVLGGQLGIRYNKLRKLKEAKK